MDPNAHSSSFSCSNREACGRKLPVHICRANVGFLPCRNRMTESIDRIYSSFKAKIRSEFSDWISSFLNAVSKMYKPDGEEVLVHECKKCGLIRKNRVAGDDSIDLIEKLPKIDYFKD